MVQEPRAPDTLFFRVFRFLSPPQPTDGLRGPRQTADWEVLLLVPPRSSLHYLGVLHSQANWQEARGLCQLLVNQNSLPGTIISQWVFTHWLTPVAPGDFGLGLMTLRHQKHWPTVTNLCRNRYLQSASSKRKISRKCFEFLHRHSETFLQVPMLLPVLGFCSLKASL